MNPHMFQRMIWGLVLVYRGHSLFTKPIRNYSIDVAYMFSTFGLLFLFFMGSIGFVSQRKYHWGGSIGSLMMCGVGTIFLLKNLNLTDLSLGEMFKFLGPVALIFFGLNVIFRPSKKESPDWPSIKDSKDKKEGTTRSRIDCAIHT